MKPSTLTLGTKKMRGPRLGADSRFPAMRNPIGSNIAAELDEFDGLYLNYGMFNDSLPFVMQDQYDSEPEELEFRTAVLENDHLRATFILELGVRLWSLYDKDRQRDLLLNNTEFRPNNLAIRNAWFAGGVEYNIGRRGHDEQTCSPRFVAKLQDSDGTPVLLCLCYLHHILFVCHVHPDGIFLILHSNCSGGVFHSACCGFSVLRAASQSDALLLLLHLL